MGCASSKEEYSELVPLCQERTELIGAARDLRYVLAAAHAAYFRSLAAVGDALHRFVQEELALAPAPVLAPMPVPAPESVTRSVTSVFIPTGKRNPGSERGTAPSTSSAATSFSHSLSADGSHLPLSSASGSTASLCSGGGKGSAASGKAGSSDRSSEGTNNEATGKTGRSDISKGTNNKATGKTGSSDCGSKGKDSSSSHQRSSPRTPGKAGSSDRSSEGTNNEATGKTGRSDISKGTNNKATGKTGSSDCGSKGKDSSSSRQRSSPRTPGGGKGTDASEKVGRSRGGKGNGSSSSYQRVCACTSESLFMRPSTAIPTLVYESREYIIEPSAPAVAPDSPPFWEPFNPFNAYEEFLPGGKYGARSSGSSPDLNEVRKQEGIPELEVEAEVEQTRMVKKEKSDDAKLRRNKVAGVDLGRKDPTSESANTPSTGKHGREDKKIGGVLLGKKENESNSVGVESRTNKDRSSGEDKVSNGNKKGVSFDDMSSYVTEESVPGTQTPLSSQNGTQTSVFQCTRDVMEAMQKIQEHFRSASACGVELADMLEVDEVPYRSDGRMYTTDCTALPLLTKSRSSLLQCSIENRTRRKVSNMAANNHTNARSLLLSLEKLYVWEKKLYKEVKEGEELRIKYEKMYRLLRTLDARGAENSKIDFTWATVRALHIRISIICKSVNGISSRMHKIRDEELQPQLVELIQGFFTMWKSILDCHQKQTQVLLACEAQRLVVKTTQQKKYAAKELEVELINWCKCFIHWISAQKSYTEALNGWLMKWLPQEQEQTLDGILPLSPTRIGAPTAFIISNDWYHAIKRISVDKVILRMRAFTDIIRTIREGQDEEWRQRLELVHLARAYERQVKSIHASREKNLENIPLSGHDSLKDHNNASVVLESKRKRLHEKRSIHSETLKQLQDAASSILPIGLVPLCEELSNCTSEVLQVFNGIRNLGNKRGE